MACITKYYMYIIVLYSIENTIYYIYFPRMNTEKLSPWNCFIINDDTEASDCLRKIRLLTKDLTERSKCDA